MSFSRIGQHFQRSTDIERSLQLHAVLRAFRQVQKDIQGGVLQTKSVQTGHRPADHEYHSGTLQKRDKEGPVGLRENSKKLGGNYIHI